MPTATKTATPRYTTKDLLPKTFGLYILYVNDWDKAVSFYQDTLGWEPTCKEEGWAEFKTGGVRFALHATSNGKAVKPVDTHLDFFVQNVDKTMAALKAKGVKVAAEAHNVCGDVWVGSFQDPFGNTFGFCGVR
ncbi:MAG: VOC family protein [Planctomycetes bacterium]|nr:VOC family protein [Planctomycetota bacterium]